MMTELVEYTLVVMVSALFIGGSAATYDSFANFAAGVQFQAASDSIGRLVSQAAVGGSSTGSISIPSSTIICGGEVLSIRSGARASEQGVPGSCDFELNVTAGDHTMRFQYSGQLLSMSVS
jgi:hypothetical protein